MQPLDDRGATLANEIAHLRGLDLDGFAGA
jgi:hypothetical protein